MFNWPRDTRCCWETNVTNKSFGVVILFLTLSDDLRPGSIWPMDIIAAPEKKKNNLFLIFFIQFRKVLEEQNESSQFDPGTLLLFPRNKKKRFWRMFFRCLTLFNDEAWRLPVWIIETFSRALLMSDLSIQFCVDCWNGPGYCTLLLMANESNRRVN